MFSRLVRIIKGSDNRRERRVPVRMHATMGDYPGRITDLSLGGCGFYADEGGVLQVGKEVTAHLMPPGHTPIEVPARIVGQDDEGMVYCVAFTEVNSETFDGLQSIIVHQAFGDHASR